jgi:hypothetical protein
MKRPLFLVLGALTGCGSPCGQEPPLPQPLGTFDVTSAPTPSLAAATIEVTAESVTLSYDDEAGRTWTVVFEVQ